MENPLYQQYKPQINNNQFAQIFEQAKQFGKTINGNPRDIVQSLLNSGQMSQAQFNAYSQTAQQIMQSVGGKM